jgi:hypothetical protein
MADNSVFITGIAEDTLANEIRKLPAWATEDTLSDISEFLEKSMRIQGKTLEGLNKLKGIGGGAGGGLSPADAKKVNDELEKLARNLHTRNADDELEKRRKKREAGLAKDKLGKDEKVNKILGMIAAVGGKVFAAETKYLDVYDSLYTSGINLLNGNNSTTDGFESLNQMVIQTGLRLETLQKIMEKYSSSVNAIGATKFTKALASATPKLNQLGYYGESAGDMIGTLIESEMGYMDIRGKSSEAIAADSVKLAGQLSRLSKTMGMSEQQVQENMKATAKSSDAMLIASRYGTDAAGNFSKAAAGVKDAGLREMFTELAGAANPAQVKGYLDLVSAGFGAEAEQLNRLAHDMLHITPKELTARLDSLGKQFNNAGGKIAGLAPIWDKGGKAAGGLVNAVIQQSRATSQATEGQMDNAQKTQASLAGLNQQIERTKAIVEAAFFPMIGQVNAATSALKLFNDAVYGGIKSTDAQVRSNLAIAAMVLGGLAVIGPKISSTISILTGSSEAFAKSTASVTSRLISAGGSLIALAGAAYLGYQAGTVLYNSILNDKGRENVQDVVGGVSDWVMDNIFGGEDAAHRRKVNAQVEKMNLSPGTAVAPKKSTEISVPKSPAATTIDSPSAVPAGKPAKSSTDGSDAPTASAATSPAIERPGADAEVNSLLGNQAKIMAQVLESTNALLSVNKDILKYTRARA